MVVRSRCCTRWLRSFARNWHDLGVHRYWMPYMQVWTHEQRAAADIPDTAEQKRVKRKDYVANDKTDV